MRYLGIDYGTKRVGLALSDESGTMAFPHKVVPNDRELLGILESIIETEQVSAVVIGQSLDKHGQPNPVQAHIESLITDLTLACGVPVHLEPEFYTTKEATRFQGKTALTDAAAAAVILNSFLSKQMS